MKWTVARQRKLLHVVGVCVLELDGGAVDPLAVEVFLLRKQK